jgi:hypothetical protein
MEIEEIDFIRAIPLAVLSDILYRSRDLNVRLVCREWRDAVVLGEIKRLDAERRREIERLDAERRREIERLYDERLREERDRAMSLWRALSNEMRKCRCMWCNGCLKDNSDYMRPPRRFEGPSLYHMETLRSEREALRCPSGCRPPV